MGWGGSSTPAAGGYVVGAGSTVGGRPYEVTCGEAPAPLPVWLAERLRPAPLPAQRAAGGGRSTSPCPRGGPVARAGWERKQCKNAHIGPPPDSGLCDACEGS